MPRVAVVGGGLAGLVVARRLAEHGVDVTLFERRDTLGGRVRSIREDGFVFDRGFQVLFTAYPAVRRELDLEALDLRRFTAGATIAHPGRRSVLSDPRSSPGDLTETLFNSDVPLTDVIRLFRLERRLSRLDADALFDRGADRSIEAYLAEQGFSTQFVDNFARPFYGGITLDRSLSTDAGVFRYTFRMLSAGHTTVPARGMGAISDQLAEAARESGVDFERDTAVESLTPADDEVTIDTSGESVTADAAVVATDPPTAAELTDVDAIPTATRGCVTQYYGLPGRITLDPGTKLVLNAADGEPNQFAPLSAVAPEYAPADRTLLSATWLGSPERSDEALAERGRTVLESWYPERRFDDLELLHTERVPVAQFEQPPGFRRDLPEANAPAGPVVLAGDYTEWSSLQGALESGRTAATVVRETLQ